jgi:hypothetical protein
MSIMPHPWVYSAKVTGDKITFSVEVTDLQTTQGAIEVTGQAMQVGGAFAPIYAITDVPKAPNGDPDDRNEAGRYFVDVEATPNSGLSFVEEQDVTVFVRVSKVWVTVLGPGTDDGPDGPNPRTKKPGLLWGVHKGDAGISKPSESSAGSS